MNMLTERRECKLLFRITQGAGKSCLCFQSYANIYFSKPFTLVSTRITDLFVTSENSSNTCGFQHVCHVVICLGF